MNSAKPPLICLMGPTASGKTDLAIQLAERRNCELISVDSALVYRGLDIGSAKPDYPHHLVDIRDPSEPYSAADFAADARRLVTDIQARGKTPLLVGGTMLYFRAFLEGLADMPAADPAIRAAIEQEAAEHGWPHIHAELAEVDPEAAARIHPNHSQRLARALEVYRASGIPMSEWHRRQGAESEAGSSVHRCVGPRAAPYGALPEAPFDGSFTNVGCTPVHHDGRTIEHPYDPYDHFDVLQLAICPKNRVVLHERIALRFEIMMREGFLEEVRGLYNRRDLTPDLPAIRAVGYRQLWQHLAGECSLEEAVQKAIAATRQLAKRQLTWLRKWPDLGWIYTDQAGNVLEVSWSHPQAPTKGTDLFSAENKSVPFVGSPLDAALNYLGYVPT